MANCNVVFVDDSKTLLQEWMGNSASATNMDFTSEVHTDSIPLRGKAGLGARTPHAVGQDHTDALAIRLSKNAKKRKLIDSKNQDQDNDDIDFHGTVEEDMDESKIRAVSRRSKSTIRPLAKISQSETDAAAFAASGIKPQNIVADIKILDDSTPGEGLDQIVKRKRVKTRSKQKNIRRDNRPATVKPAHLQIGSKDYKGRPITKVSSLPLFP